MANDLVIEETPPKYELELSQDVSRGSIVGWRFGWRKATARAADRTVLEYIALEDGLVGQAIQVIREAVMVAPAIVGGGDANTLVYVSAVAGFEGTLTTTVPTGTGDTNAPIGVMLRPGRVHVTCQHWPDSVVA